MNRGLRHEHRHWRSLAVPSPLLAELRALARDRERLIFNQRDVENQLRAIVLTYLPGLLGLFSSLDRDITLAFLREYPTPAHASRVAETRMAAFCGRHGYSGRTRPEVLVERLRTHLLSASDGITVGKAFAALMFADQLDLLNTQIRAITKRISQRLHAHPDAEIFLSFPGMGEVIAATMLAEMGEDRTRFPSPGVLLAETGTAPVTRSSGRSSMVRFRYAANNRMRHAIDWWTFVAVRETTGPTTPTNKPATAASSTTGPCVASAPAGCGSCGAAGPTTPPTTRHITIIRWPPEPTTL